MAVLHSRRIVEALAAGQPGASIEQFFMVFKRIWIHLRETRQIQWEREMAERGGAERDLQKKKANEVNV